VVLSLKKRRIFRNSFRYPIGEQPRTAILVNWFHTRAFRFGREDSARVFTNAREAAHFAPEAVAATREQLLHMGHAELPSVTHALISLVRPGDRLLTTSERDQLWRTFEVPVFEQIIGERGELNAGECEAHDGLHIYSTDWTPDEEIYGVNRSACVCGLKLPRISSSEIAERVRAVVA
jgi:hypothetical protein